MTPRNQVSYAPTLNSAMILPYPPLLMPLQSKGLAPTRYPHLPPPHELTPTRRSPLPFAMPPPAASHLQGLLLVTSQARNQTSDWLFPRHYCTTRKSFSNFCTFYHFFLTCGCSFSLASELKGKVKTHVKTYRGQDYQNYAKYTETCQNLRLVSPVPALVLRDSLSESIISSDYRTAHLLSDRLPLPTLSSLDSRASSQRTDSSAHKRHLPPTLATPAPIAPHHAPVGSLGHYPSPLGPPSSASSLVSE